MALSALQLASLKRTLRAELSGYAYQDPLPLRLIATRTSVPESDWGGSGTAAYHCFPTQARDDLTSLRVIWAHWWGNAIAPASPLVITAAEIEYPASVYTPVTFNGGSASVTKAPLSNLTSDPVNVSIPNGAWFKVRVLLASGYCILTRTNNATIGEGVVYPATGLNLVTARSATFNNNTCCPPSAIIGSTSKRSVLILGDSRPSGFGDAFTRADGTYGNAGGALNAYAWAQMVQWGGKATDYLSGAGALQAELAAYATDIVSELAANDFFAGSTAASVLATQALIRARYPSARYHLCTIEPKSGSTDLWATLLNQTPDATANAQLQLYNAAVLANAMAYDKPIDLASVSESSLASGKWKVDGTANKYTIDGIHQSPFAYGLYSSAGFTL